MFDFKGKTALITGASVGIGRATALEMAKAGANLVLLDVDFEKLESVQKEIGDDGRVLIMKCDISDQEAVEQCTKTALEQFGKIDILVNNAAIWRIKTPFAEMEPETWRKLFDINVHGTAYMTKAVLPGMLKQGYGRIINVASVAGVYGNANMACYSAAKGAIIAFTQALAKEVCTQGVLVNAVSPGTVTSSKISDVDAYTPTELCRMGRTGTARENANLICFLASDAASYISGQNIQIDGVRRKI